MPRTIDWYRRLLVVVLLLPLASMWLVPFSDTSEPRYAEIARLMAQTGDWITPWFRPGVPFWGKPPLSFWAEALSMRYLGVNEFAARLPSWLCLLLSVFILYRGLRILRGRRVAILSALIYATSTLVYVASGAVLTDPFLALGTNLSFVTFAVLASEHRRQCATQAFSSRLLLFCRIGFFVGVAIGLLAKGPLAAAIILVPSACWCAMEQYANRPQPRMAWAKGLLLAALISAPWYILAEFKTPGFLDYFIVGEHIRRFLDAGWHGDLYGTAHREAYGTIWLYWLQATFPWGLALLAMLAASWRSARVRGVLRPLRHDALFPYWLAWAAFTPLFFTFSANILWTYILPAIAPLSVLVALPIERLLVQGCITRRHLLPLFVLVPVAVLMWTGIAWHRPDTLKSERGLVRYALQRGNGHIPLRYLGGPPFSAQFYSKGTAEAVGLSALAAGEESEGLAFVAIPKDEAGRAQAALGHQLNVLYENRRYLLVRCGSSTQEAILPQEPRQRVAKHLPKNRS
ncbi:glycosyltransferase family 39 protein [Allopusillimonas soli]|uniref:Glycosyltransferase family 39 protein n=1 Tax=Allopusillimonas soli TaxID=659016 RepID=A0A853F5F8_9BURK|nr:glycosyltransferase family 39 protein [Allopusillimonas soli]NYT35343.1 glycosyltransferase family 39 protein [Allopusillimonas soli]TEA75765.1 glycosyltransferase family 39 protein [Allopusillimonas soli]